MRIVPFGSSGKIGRNLGFLTKEYLLTLVLLKKKFLLKKNLKENFWLKSFSCGNSFFAKKL